MIAYTDGNGQEHNITVVEDKDVKCPHCGDGYPPERVVVDKIIHQGKYFYQVYCDRCSMSSPWMDNEQECINLFKRIRIVP